MAEAGESLNLDPAFLGENRAGVLQGIAIAFVVITTVMIALRFFAKFRFQSPDPELFDVFLVAAYVITLGMCALGISKLFFFLFIFCLLPTSVYHATATECQHHVR